LFCTGLSAKERLDNAPQSRVPRSSASVSLFGTSTPFATSTLADVTGHFHFKKLKPGLYSLAILIRRREARRTVEVGPSSADRKRRVSLTVELHEFRFRAGRFLAPQQGLGHAAFHSFTTHRALKSSRR
jgi:hypothetical protein